MFSCVISSAISIEFFMLYVFGKIFMFCNLLLRNLAILCERACVLLITGLIGMSSLCVFKWALSCGAFGCMLIRCLCIFFVCLSFAYIVELPVVFAFEIWLLGLF